MYEKAKITVFIRAPYRYIFQAEEKWPNNGTVPGTGTVPFTD
jgi:hypothetical protein